MHDFVSLLDSASSKIRNAMSMMLETVSGANGADAHEGASDASITNSIPGLTGDAKTIDSGIDKLEREQADLLDERRRLVEQLRMLPDGARPGILAQIAAVDQRLAEIQPELDTERGLLGDEFVQIHNDTIADLEAQLLSIPNHPAFHIERAAITAEIAQRNDLFNAGITEPYLMDELIDMSNSPDPLVRNTYQRILDGDVTLLTFSEQEASLEDALAYDRDFDPRTEIALYLPPDDRIRIYKKSVGGLSLGDSGFILIKDGKGESVLVHEVNHSLNADSNTDFIGSHTGDDREAIRSFTTEVRAYNVDNTFESDASATASSVSSAHPRADRAQIILNDLGYPNPPVGNQVHIAEAVQEVTAGFPPPPNPLSDEQIAQIERIYIADHILDHDILTDNPVYDEAVAQYDATETVRDTINEIIIDGAGGIEDNTLPADGTS